MKKKRVREKYYENESDSVLKKQTEKTVWEIQRKKRKSWLRQTILCAILVLGSSIRQHTSAYAHVAAPFATTTHQKYIYK
jgi:hypothetical protein